MKLISISHFLLILISSISFSYAETSISSKKKVLEYKKILEEEIEKKVNRVLNTKSSQINVKLTTILSSERVQNIKKDISLPLTAMVSDENSKIFVESAKILITTPMILTFRQQDLIESEIKLITNLKSLTVDFAHNSGLIPWWEKKEYQLVGLGIIGFTFVALLLFWGIRYRNNKKKLEMTKKENQEFEILLNKYVSLLKSDSEVLNIYLDTDGADVKAVKTLAEYINLHFNLKEILTASNYSSIRNFSGIYEPKELKVWMSSNYTRFLLLNDEENENQSLKVEELFDYSVLLKYDQKDFTKVLKKYSLNDVVCILHSLPSFLKFQVFESAKIAFGMENNKLLEKLNDDGDVEYDLFLMENFVKEMERSHDSFNEGVSDVA